MIETVNSGEWLVISKSKRAIKYKRLQASGIGMMLLLGMSGAMRVEADDEQGDNGVESCN